MNLDGHARITPDEADTAWRYAQLAEADPVEFIGRYEYYQPEELDELFSENLTEYESYFPNDLPSHADLLMHVAEEHNIPLLMLSPNGFLLRHDWKEEVMA